ncbi:hypothetical protein [Aquimarina sp. I32.4]|uniref:hypothetical protein n=1 Tax=Aquimarina sp. I32.4 TaxID=2053903 RepID=UPI0011AF923B|nr:hypothetical protein [Aquimarina sp. I32.4]
MNCIIIISVFLSLVYFLQGDIDMYEKDVCREIIIDDTLRSDDVMIQNQIPEYDFLIISNSGGEAIFIATLSKKDINDAIERTRFMSAIPPTTITLYNKGKLIKDVACGLALPASKRQKITEHSKKFDTLKQYQRKKVKLTASKKKVYFLEQENKNEYCLNWFEY